MDTNPNGYGYQQLDTYDYLYFDARKHRHRVPDIGTITHTHDHGSTHEHHITVSDAYTDPTAHQHGLAPSGHHPEGTGGD